MANSTPVLLWVIYLQTIYLPETFSWFKNRPNTTKPLYTVRDQM